MLAAVLLAHRLLLGRYVLCFYAHFALLPSTGPGVGFMTPRFRATLEGDEYTPHALAEFVRSGQRTKYGVLTDASLPDFWGKFVELNFEMLRANEAIRTGHDWGSRWWEWPLMHRSVLYWVAKVPGYTAPHAGTTAARIYCIGTPIVWWLAAAGPTLLVAWAVALPVLHARRALPWRLLGVGAFLSVGYLVNWLPFVIVERVAFLYHFLPSLMYSLLLLGFMLDRLLPPVPLMASPPDAAADTAAEAAAPAAGGGGGAAAKAPPTTAAPAAAELEPFHSVATRDGALRWLVAAACIQVMAGFFAFFAPIMYGTPLSQDGLDMRFWLKGWQ